MPQKSWHKKWLKGSANGATRRCRNWWPKIAAISHNVSCLRLFLRRVRVRENLKKSQNPFSTSLGFQCNALVPSTVDLPDLPPHPDGGMWSLGMGLTRNGAPMMCKESSCVYYDAGTNGWKNGPGLQRPKSRASTARAKDGIWWIVGGTRWIFFLIWRQLPACNVNKLFFLVPAPPPTKCFRPESKCAIHIHQWFGFVGLFRGSCQVSWQFFFHKLLDQS